ncbi:MAG: ABC transporter ATP-binding protein [Acidobacteria bacterium]|nr:ABC transporter ATP-binding protein [Acidobacteriota bacterium]
MALLELIVRKSFPASSSAPGFALDVSLHCEAGVTVLFGSSGSGKTLTLDCLAGFLRPEQGRIFLNNEILFDADSGVCLSPQRRGIGYVFQNYALFPHMTLAENLAFGIARLPVLERRQKIREMLDLFGLADLSARRPHELSGGEKQRASIARALVTEPRLLLLDEPVRGLDHPLRLDFYGILRNIRKKYQIPILLVTHDIQEGFTLAEQIAVYEAGRIIQVGPPDQIFFRPRNTAVARLLGISNIFSGTVEELDPMADCTRIRTKLFSVSLPYLPGRLRGDTVWFCIPQEHVQLVQPAASKGDPSRQNRIPVQVVEEIVAPSTVRLMLRVQATPGAANGSGPPFHLESEVSRLAYKKMGIARQKDWLVDLPKNFIHIFSEKDTGLG